MKKRSFVMNPMQTFSRDQIRQDKIWYDDHKRELRNRIGPHYDDLEQIVTATNVGEMTKHGLIVDSGALAVLPTIDHPIAKVLSPLFDIFNRVDPSVVPKAQEEILATVGQLRDLGHEVHINDFGDESHDPYIRAALQKGAKRRQPDPEVKDYYDFHQRVGGVLEVQGDPWARDDYSMIGDEKVFPDKRVHEMDPDSPLTTMLGSGGGLVPVAPKTFAISEAFAEDPRIKGFEKKGFTFYSMPEGLVHAKSLTDFLGRDVYARTTHIDHSIGAVPEKKVPVVDPLYFDQHKFSVQNLVDNHGLKRPITVPKEEAHRLSANFLNLGDGRVLVDKGSPKLIAKLRKEGVDVVESVMPLDFLPHLRGGLRCMFNEL